MQYSASRGSNKGDGKDKDKKSSPSQPPPKDQAANPDVSGGPDEAPSSSSCSRTRGGDAAGTASQATPRSEPAGRSTGYYKIKVSNLPDGITEEVLKNEFKSIGDVLNVESVKSGVYAMGFKTHLETDAAVSKYNGRQFQGKKLNVKNFPGLWFDSSVGYSATGSNRPHQDQEVTRPKLDTPELESGGDSTAIAYYRMKVSNVPPHMTEVELKNEFWLVGTVLNRPLRISEGVWTVDFQTMSEVKAALIKYQGYEAKKNRSEFVIDSKVAAVAATPRTNTWRAPSSEIAATPRSNTWRAPSSEKANAAPPPKTSATIGAEAAGSTVLDKRVIFVGNLPTGISANVVRNFFLTAGHISRYLVFPSKGHARIEFHTEAEARVAIARYKYYCGPPFGRYPIIVDELKSPVVWPPTETPAEFPADGLLSLRMGVLRPREVRYNIRIGRIPRRFSADEVREEIARCFTINNFPLEASQIKVPGSESKTASETWAFVGFWTIDHANLARRYLITDVFRGHKVRISKPIKIQ